MPKVKFNNIFNKSDDSKEIQEVLEDEIMSIVSEGKEQGVLPENEARMISNIFALDDMVAKDIVTNRSQIVAFDSEMTIDEVINEILNNSFSRYPIYDGDIDHIIGILHLKDAIKIQHKYKGENFALKDKPEIFRKPMVVPEAKELHFLFREMQITKTQMVIVIDEYGQTTGLIAMEDILEEIVGNIQDEYDEEDNLITVNAPHKSYIIDGLTPLSELEETLHIEFEEEHFDTINGLLISRLQHIPEKDEEIKFVISGYEFVATEVEDKCIKTIQVTAME